MDGDSSAQSQSLTGHRSEPKVLMGQKRGSIEVEATSEKSQRRVKMRDLESVLRSEDEETTNELNVAQAGRGGNSTAHLDICYDSRAVDLNVGVGSVNCMVGDDDPKCVGESRIPPISGKKDVQFNDGAMKARGFDLDLNAADISSSINDPFNPYKMSEHLRNIDDSDCVSSVGPLKQKDPMSVWKGLKQNNYMSTSYGSVPMGIPKARGRKKSSHDVMKKKMELAKKEQVDRFARVAAPSGLLNGLNPGIINHVRNSKQVHSIIEALVKSEKSENLLSGSKKHDQIKSGAQEHPERMEASYGAVLSGRMQMSDYAFFSKSVYSHTVYGNSCTGHTKTFSTVPSHCEKENEDDKLPPKLSSVTVASENASCLSNGESSVTSLSLKAANVASQWLELLNQDIRGRLAALRRSKKRVQTVMDSELPLLMLREFSSNLESDVHTTNGSTACPFDQANADAHFVKWNSLFAQMEKALSEEESHLENWLNQVKEMQLHCEMGLNKSSLHHASQQRGPLGNDNRWGAADKLEKDLAVRAAAASVYSTCNFLLSRENLPCC